MCNILATGAVCCYSTHSKHSMTIIAFARPLKDEIFFFATSIEDSMVWKCENLTFSFCWCSLKSTSFSRKLKTRGFFRTIPMCQDDHPAMVSWSAPESPWSKSGPFRRQDWPGGKNGGWGDRSCLDQVSSRRLLYLGPQVRKGNPLF